MSKIYGYVRISTLDQNEDRQLDAMERCEVPQKNISVDKISGKDFNCPQYQRMVKKLRSGDLLFILSIDRLGRNYEEVQNQRRILCCRSCPSWRRTSGKISESVRQRELRRQKPGA